MLRRRGRGGHWLTSFASAQRAEDGGQAVRRPGGLDERRGRRERGREAGTKEASALGACWLSLPLSREMVDGPRSSRRGLSAWDAVLKIATNETTIFCLSCEKFYYPNIITHPFIECIILTFPSIPVLGSRPLPLAATCK